MSTLLSKEPYYETIEQTESFLPKRPLSRKYRALTSLYYSFICIYWPYWSHGILLSLWLIFMGMWIHSRHRSLALPYSPANVAIEYQQGYEHFKGTLNHTSIYRGKPSPEVDAAWIKVSTGVPPMRITREQSLMLGEKDTASKVKYRDEDGRGYMAALEVTHQLHCLDILRKSVYLDYYRQVDPLFQAEEEVYRFHLGEQTFESLRAMAAEF